MISITLLFFVGAVCLLGLYLSWLLVMLRFPGDTALRAVGYLYVMFLFRRLCL